jgi:hypothetical protein
MLGGKLMENPKNQEKLQDLYTSFKWVAKKYEG